MDPSFHFATSVKSRSQSELSGFVTIITKVRTKQLKGAILLRCGSRFETTIRLTATTLHTPVVAIRRRTKLLGGWTQERRLKRCPKIAVQVNPTTASDKRQLSIRDRVQNLPRCISHCDYGRSHRPSDKNENDNAKSNVPSYGPSCGP